MPEKPVKPKVAEYRRTPNRNECSSGLRLIAAELRYVDETPGITWWWEDVVLPADHELNECPYAYRDTRYKGETHTMNCHPDFPENMARESLSSPECARPRSRRVTVSSFAYWRRGTMGHIGLTTASLTRNGRSTDPVGCRIGAV